MTDVMGLKKERILSNPKMNQRCESEGAREMKSSLSVSHILALVGVKPHDRMHNLLPSKI